MCYAQQNSSLLVIIMSTPLVSSSSSSSSVAFFHPSSSFHHHQPASSPLLPITRTRIIKKAWPVIKCELCDEQQQLASSSSSSKVKRADEELAALINITGGKKDVDDEKAQEGGDGSKEEEEVDATAGAMINFIKVNIPIHIIHSPTDTECPSYSHLYSFSPSHLIHFCRDINNWYHLYYHQPVVSYQLALNMPLILLKNLVH